MSHTNFVIQAGESWPGQGNSQRVRVTLPATRTYWLELADFEVLMQLRTGDSEDDELVADLSDSLTVSMDALDIVIDWEMTGAKTRTLGDGGYYDMVISDPDTVDAHALIVLYGRLKVNQVVTAAARTL